MIRSVRRLQCCVMKTTSGHDEVDTAATNRGVVTSSVVCIVLNYFISEILYGGAL